MGMIVKGKNDIFTLNPKWENYFDNELNQKDNIDPYSLTRYTHKKVHLICQSCGKKFIRSVAKIKEDILCSDCSLKKGLLKKYNNNLNDNGSLSSNYPELARQWHPTKNGKLTPNDVSCGSGKKVWWVCNEGHEWEAVVHSRTVSKRDCPICTNQKVLKGYNDLETIFPYLLKEWNYKKNTILPSEIIARSGKKYWWICELGHEWQTSPLERSYGRGCPTCSSERSVSVGEKTILFYIKQNYDDEIIPNYRDVIINNKELDIYLPNLKIGIEYDGVYFHKDKSRDLLKDKICANLGIKVIHVAESTIENKIDDNYIYYNVNKESNFEWAILELLKKIFQNKKDFNINISRDRIDVYNLLEYSIKQQSLLVNYPELAKQWHPTKNGKLAPDLVSYGSDKKVWWLCEKNHEWNAVISSRVNGSGCPYCANQKILKGYNDLETLYPDIAKQWNYKKNKTIPSEIAAKSNKKYWWICDKGHEWETTVYNRTFGYGCPICANQKILKGYNDLETVNPELAKQWHPTKNGILTPRDVTANSRKKVWWIDEHGHEWEAVISDRYNGDNGCPYCSNHKILKGYNDLITKNPELLREWDFEKNKNISPYDFFPNTRKKVWWVCDKGHSYDAYISDKSRSYGCPICSNKRILIGYNDLASTNPELLVEWDYEKNSIKPNEITNGSGKRVWWKCPKCNNSWQAVILERVKGYNKCNNCYERKRGTNHKKSIIQLDLNGNELKTFSSIADAAKELNITSSAIHLNLSGKRKQVGGFIWKYKNKN